MMNKETIGGIIGTSVSVVGTGLQTNEMLQTISLIITIIGSLITITMAIVNWWKNAKKDGKIDKDEINNIIDILNNGINVIKDDKEDKEEEKK